MTSFNKNMWRRKNYDTQAKNGKRASVNMTSGPVLGQRQQADGFLASGHGQMTPWSPRRHDHIPLVSLARPNFLVHLPR